MFPDAVREAARMFLRGAGRACHMAESYQTVWIGEATLVSGGENTLVADLDVTDTAIRWGCHLVGLLTVLILLCRGADKLCLHWMPVMVTNVRTNVFSTHRYYASHSITVGAKLP